LNDRRKLRPNSVDATQESTPQPTTTRGDSIASMVVTTRTNARPQLVKEEELVKETDEDDFDEGTDEARADKIVRSKWK